MRYHVISIQREEGLQLRPAARLVEIAEHFKSKIELTVNGRTADAHSILAIMMLHATRGTSVEIRVSGEDENEALETINSILCEQSAGRALQR